MQQGLDVTTIYYTFVSKLDISMRSLVDNISVNKRASGRGSVILADIVSNCRDQLSG